jgi:hypothetical protein
MEKYKNVKKKIKKYNFFILNDEDTSFPISIRALRGKIAEKKSRTLQLGRFSDKISFYIFK